MDIRFATLPHTSRLVPPAGGQTTSQLEIRLDPLTGRTTHIAHFGAVEAVPLNVASYEWNKTRQTCPFCPEHRHSSIPRFPPDVVPEGTLTRGEAILFPNLYPYDAYGSVCVLSDAHVVRMEDLAGRLPDALELGITFWQRIRISAPTFPYPIMIWNYMPPSGGGLVHPHLQFFAFQEPGNRYREEFEASARFQKRFGRDYWGRLVEVERTAGDRYIGRTGPWHWLSAFAPVGILGEIIGILPGAWDLDTLPTTWETGLVNGLERCFAFFRSQGIASFNAALFLGPKGQEHFAAHVRIAPRTFLNTVDWAPDTNAFQVLLEEPVCVVRPEEFARLAQKYFSPDHHVGKNRG